MPIDFLSALVAAWDADAVLIAAGATPLHNETPPPGLDPPYPYVTYTRTRSRVLLRTAGKGYLDDVNLNFNIYSPDYEQVRALAATITTFLDAIGDAPLAFDEGGQVAFHRTGDHGYRLPRSGAGGNIFLYVKTLTYRLEVARERA